MSATLRWRPAKPGKGLDCDYVGSDFEDLADALERDGANEFILEQSDIGALRMLGRAKKRPIYDHLADLIEKAGAIWLERFYG